MNKTKFDIDLDKQILGVSIPTDNIDMFYNLAISVLKPEIALEEIKWSIEIYYQYKDNFMAKQEIFMMSKENVNMMMSFFRKTNADGFMKVTFKAEQMITEENEAISEVSRIDVNELQRYNAYRYICEAMQTDAVQLNFSSEILKKIYKVVMKLKNANFQLLLDEEIEPTDAFVRTNAYISNGGPIEYLALLRTAVIKQTGVSRAPSAIKTEANFGPKLQGSQQSHMSFGEKAPPNLKYPSLARKLKNASPKMHVPERSSYSEMEQSQQNNPFSMRPEEVFHSPLGDLDLIEQDHDQYKPLDGYIKVVRQSTLQFDFVKSSKQTKQNSQGHSEPTMEQVKDLSNKLITIAVKKVALQRSLAGERERVLSHLEEPW